MTTKAAADWLDTVITSDLSVTCTMGFPAWDRPDIASGAYIEWRQDGPEYDQRTSKALDVWITTFQMVVVTASELALWAMVDAIKTMAAARTEATISNQRTRVRWSTIARAEAQEATVMALRYAAVATIEIT